MGFEQKIQAMRIVRLDDEYHFKHFDCGDNDLNEFLLKDAKDYQRRLLAVTYLIENEDDIVAYFSLANDKISLNESNKSVWRKIKRNFPRSKHRRDYPAVKIGRLAVNKSYQGLQIGTIVMNYLKNLFKSRSRTGCAYLTVDALSKAVGFYEKNGFDYLCDKVSGQDYPTRLMYFDINRLK